MGYSNILPTNEKKELLKAERLLRNSKESIKQEKDIAKAIQLMHQSLDIYKNIRKYTKIKEIYNSINEILHRYNQIDEAKKQSILALNYYENELKLCKPSFDSYADLKLAIANSYANYGISFTREDDLERGHYYFSLSLSIFDKYGNWDQRVQTYLNLASVNQALGRNNKSLQYLHQSLNCAHQTENPDNIFHLVVLNLANLYFQQNNFEKAIQFFSKSFEYLPATSVLQKYSVNVYYGLAHSYFELGNDEKCLDNLNKAIELDNETDAKLYEALIASLKGRILVQKRDFLKAIPFYAQSLKINSRLVAKTRRLNSINDIITFYTLASPLEIKKLEEVLVKNHLSTIEEFIEELEKTPIEFYNIWNLKKTYESLSRFYEKDKKYHLAYKCLKKVNHINKQIVQISVEDQVNLIHHNFDIYRLQNKIETATATTNQLEVQKEALENKVNEIKEKLANKHLKLKEFTNILAHDLKEPARQINSHIDFLIKKVNKKLNSDELILANHVLDNSKRLISMMDDLIVYSFLHNQKQKEVKTNINQLIGALIKTYQEIDSSNIQIEIPETLETKISSNHLTQIFRRLIDNSIKFRNQALALKINISSIVKDGITYIKVADNGIGFDSENVEKAFEIFKKMHNDKHEGNGVGLAICKKIIKLYDQKITIKTKPENGCTVTFSIPV